MTPLNPSGQDDDLSDAEIARLVHLDATLSGDTDFAQAIPDDDNEAPGVPGTRTLDFINQVRAKNPHCIDDLSAESTMSSWLDMESGQPKRIGRHQLIERLGTGGFGVVFLAIDPDLDRKVALKVPRIETLIQPQTRRRFLRESRSAAQLDHPNIATIYEAGSAGPILYIASQYCPGGSLESYLELMGGRLPPKTAVYCIAAICDAVEHAHSRAILHRDIKPSNILLDVPVESLPHLEADSQRLGEVARLVDFGLAKNLATQDEQTRTGVMLGTPAYTAPEMVLEQPTVGPAADVYSLGATLYHLLAGVPPHKKGTKFETLLAAQKVMPLPPSRRAPEVPGDLDAICMKALRRQPEHRYESAAKMAEDLRAFLDGRSILARRASALENLWRRVSQNLVVAVLGIALAMMGLILATSLIFNWRNAEHSRAQSQQLEEQIRRLNDQRRLDQARQSFGMLAGTEAAKYASTFAISADGRLIALPHESGLELWDIVRGQKLYTIAETAVNVAFLDDGHSLVVAAKSSPLMKYRLTPQQTNVQRVDLSARTQLWPAPIDTNTCVMSGDSSGQLLAIQPTTVGLLHILDVQQDRIVGTRTYESPITDLAISGDDAVLAVALADEDLVELVGPFSDQVFAQISASQPQSVTFSPNSRLLAICENNQVSIRTRPRWNQSRQLDRIAFGGHVAFSADSRYMAVAVAFDKIQLIKVADLETMATLVVREDESIRMVGFTPDARHLLARTSQGRLYHWDLVFIDGQETNPQRWRFSTAKPRTADECRPMTIIESAGANP